MNQFDLPSPAESQLKKKPFFFIFAVTWVFAIQKYENDSKTINGKHRRGT